MRPDITREEFEARVGVLEREVEGEKLVTRHILEQSRLNSDDLAVIKTRLDRVEGKVDGLDRRLGAVEKRLDSVEQKLGTLVHDLPRIVAATMRDVLDERDRQR
ncbi:MAG: hypothetical protein IT536_19850 [Hyphomicrobiales bacterium]|nr:hypothetical protein [Hyphomicrobiales bacterium]